MRTIRRTSQFKRDVEQMQRRGKDLGKLKKVLESLVKDEKLSQKYRDHVLVGQYKLTFRFVQVAPKAGETITDVYDLTVPPDTPSGQYRLLIILYEPDTLAEVGRAELGKVHL
jgi:addiction module RelE/StbE family toxin